MIKLKSMELKNHGNYNTITVFLAKQVLGRSFDHLFLLAKLSLKCFKVSPLFVQSSTIYLSQTDLANIIQRIFEYIEFKKYLIFRQDNYILTY